MKRALAFLALVLLAFAAVLLGRAATLRSAQLQVPAAPRIDVGRPGGDRRATRRGDPHPDASRTRIRSQDDPAVFQAFRDHLERSFPLLHASAATRDS